MKIAFLRNLPVCWLTKRWQILRSNADFKTVHAFSHSLDPLLPVATGINPQPKADTQRRLTSRKTVPNEQPGP